MESNGVSRVDVAIIGAGWYGLASARTYLRLRPETNLIIIDSDNSVGGVWSKDRLYPNLVAQVRHGLFNYSDTPMPRNGGNPKDVKVTGEMIHDYMQKYAEDHDLLRRIRFNTFVADAKKTDGGWRLSLKGTDEVIETGKLLVATGVTSIPSLPGLDLSESAVPVIHSREIGTNYKRFADDSIKEVVVVGAAKSAYDAVYLLLKMGKKVTWAIRREGGGPLSILPYKVLNVINAIAFASTRLMSHLSPSILNTEGPMYRMLQGSSPGRWCVGRFWDFLDLNSSVHAGYGKGDHVALLKPEIDRQSVFWSNSGLGLVTLPDFWPTLHSPNLTIRRDVVEKIKGNVVKFGSGDQISADYMIMCTGWGDHFGMFDAEHKAMIGLPAYGDETEVSPEGQDIDWKAYYETADKTVNEKLPFLATPPKVKYTKGTDPALQKRWNLYRRVVPVSMAAKGDRSLAILGQIHTISTPLVSEVQSLWAVLYLLGEVELPDVDAMATEVSLWNTWTRKRYLAQGQKHTYSLYDFLPYIDSIFGDLKLNSRRKSNFVSELLSPYEPQDFNGFVDEYIRNRDASKDA
ncbi:putative flavin-binding monooxygenase-like family protein [Rosellinia necatrix]|uniref:Putative flavin-binding monooxygenase-like family protein n=1 Tax=Rosellinia necatrix TaxID=77044 RepID=A0A1S7UIP1_ROSNE|nr:putative flavin-binding monooxygenase-like family protein [Rosellinia necatrix]